MRSRLLLFLLAANVTVLAVTLYLLKAPDPTPAPASSAPAHSSAQVTPEAAGAPLPLDPYQPYDYHSRIASLRAMKCPEETIRKVVSAEVANSYRSKERQIAASVQAGTMDAKAARAEIAGLNQEKQQILGSLYDDQSTAASEQDARGYPSNAGGGVAAYQNTAPAPLAQWWGDPVPAGQANANATQTSPARIPAALAPPDPNWQLTDQQTAAWQNIVDQFSNSVGGGSQDAASPEYLQRWQSAQWLADQNFKAQFGWQAFNAQQTRAAAAQNSQ